MLLRNCLLIAAITAPIFGTMAMESKKSLTAQQRECIRARECQKFSAEQKTSATEAEWSEKRACYAACGIDKTVKKVKK